MPPPQQIIDDPQKNKKNKKKKATYSEYLLLSETHDHVQYPKTPHGGDDPIALLFRWVGERVLWISKNQKKRQAFGPKPPHS